MKQDLLAPPRLTVRKFAMIVAGTSMVTVVVGGGAMAASGWLTVGQLAIRTTTIAALSTGAIWAYARLMQVAERAMAERMPLIQARSA